MIKIPKDGYIDLGELDKKQEKALEIINKFVLKLSPLVPAVSNNFWTMEDNLAQLTGYKIPLEALLHTIEESL